MVPHPTAQRFRKRGQPGPGQVGEETFASPPPQHRRQHVIDKVRGGLGHPPAATRVADPAPLAGERHDSVVAALFAVHAKKAVLGDTAGQEVAEG